MAWLTEIPAPPKRPVVAGWFAIFNLLAQQQISITQLGRVVGVLAALQSTPIAAAAAAKGLQAAKQTVTLADAAVAAARPTAGQSFTVTDAAALAGAPLAADPLTLTELATVVAVAAALQPLPITDRAVATGRQAAGQSMTLGDAAKSAAKPATAETFSLADAATVLGSPSAANPVLLTGVGKVAAVILSPQQVALLNQGTVTGSEASVTGAQVFAISDAATVKGAQAAAQSFAVVNGATWLGKPGANQLLAITETGAVKGISSAAVSFTITNTGAVYARLTGAQTFTMTNPPAAFYGKPGTAQSFAITNAAAAVIAGFTPAYLVGVTTSTTTTIALPAHQPGDLITITAYRLNNTLTSKPGPSGTIPTWNDIDANGGANTNSMRSAQTVATASNHTSGTWTNAQVLIATVWRNVDTWFGPIGAHAEAGASALSPVTPAITPVKTNATSGLMYVYGQAYQAAAWPAAPAGYTRQALVGAATSAAANLLVNTKDDTTADGAATQTSGRTTATGYRAEAVEILGYDPTAILGDSIGPGVNGADGATSCSYTHTTIAASSTILVGFTSYSGLAPTTATCDGAAMTPVGTIANTRLYRVAVANGPHFIEFTYPNTMRWAAVDSVAYINVSSVGTPTTASGSTSGTVTQASGALAAGQVAVYLFGGQTGTNNTWSAPAGGGNTRFVQQSGNNAAAIFRDANAATTFSASFPTFADWQSMVVILS